MMCFHVDKHNTIFVVINEHKSINPLKLHTFKCFLKFNISQFPPRHHRFVSKNHYYCINIIQHHYDNFYNYFLRGIHIFN